MFIAINYITCREDYIDRFEQLMKSRAGEVDTMPGFVKMEVLRPNEISNDYLIISHWEAEEHFNRWKNSGQFVKGHKRGFEDMTNARKEGKEFPMQSVFKTYNTLTE